MLFVFCCLCSLQHSPLHSRSRTICFLSRQMRNLGLFSYLFGCVYAWEGVSFWISYNFFCVRCFCWHLVASIQCQSYRCCLFRFRVSFALSHCSSVLTSLFSCTRPRYPALTRLNIVYKQFVEFYLLCTLVFVLRLFYIRKVILLY